MSLLFSNSTNDDFPDFDGLQWNTLVSEELFTYSDRKAHFKAANTFYNIPMPLGRYTIDLKLYSYGNSAWNYQFEMV